MVEDPDVLIVGGGVIGLFCAYFLRCAGASVAVVERGSVGGSQSCSHGNTGFVGTQGATPLAEPGVLAQGLRWLLSPQSPFYIQPRLDADLVRWLWHFRGACNARSADAGFRVLVDMKRRSLEILREVCASSPLAPAFEESGIVLAFKTASGFEKARAGMARAVECGLPLRVLDPDELRALDPVVELDIAGALFNAEGGYVHTPDLITELATWLQGMGVEINGQAEVLGYDVIDRRVARVRTERGDLRPGEVVLAAGAWSAPSARRLGIRLGLQPAKGYSVTVSAPRNAPRLPVMLSEGKVAVTPLGDRLRFGGTLELSGMNGAVAPRRVDGILSTVRSFLPGLEIGGPLEVWSGLRPCTPDGLPLIGRAGGYRNLTIACGHGHTGMGLAPVTGRLVAQIIAGERAEMDLTPFRVDRHSGWTLR